MKRGSMKRIISLLLSISICLLSVACTAKPKPSAASPSAAQSTSQTLQTEAPTATPTERTYMSGQVIALEDYYAYVRETAGTASKIVGAAVLGAEFKITEYGDTWCKIIYHDTRTGYIQTRCLKTEMTSGDLPAQKLCYYVPPKEEIGPVETKFDNKLVVKLSTYTTPAPTELEPTRVETRPCIDIYTDDGTLLAANATLVLHDAVIIMPVLVDPTAPTLTPAATKIPSPASDPTYTPTPSPIEIDVTEGKLTLHQGIDLVSDPAFVIGQDLGKVIAEDGTVISYMDFFPVNATVTITNGTIYSATQQIAVEPSYYLVSTLLKDNLVDVKENSTGITFNMLFATDNNLLGYNVYGRDVCLLQKDTLDKLNQAEALFEKDGYSIIIYDAYRPYSVTLLLYDKYKTGTYLAGPRFGSVHNKGCAIDMSLLDKDGKPIEMPSPIHTLNASSNRDNPNMTAAAKANMNYMADIMRSCGFSTINSEWWHFSDTNNRSYLRTDYDLTAILQIVSP